MPQDPKGTRINKFIADEGYASRREAEVLIQKGWVLINNKTVTDLSYRVQNTDTLTLHPQAQLYLNKKKTIILNKPIGYVSAQAEDGYPPAIRLIQESQFAGKGAPPKLNLKGFAPAGRLDIDSKGLLILTQDGKVAKKIIGPESRIEKEYLVRVKGEITPSKLKQLSFGLKLDGRPLKRARISLQAPQLLNFILQEGRKRQIRRMCELVDLQVIGLKRVRIGKLKLGQLKEGHWRLLGDNELI
jgi:23S rRNA pseudouridine2604 synthase